MIAIYGLTLISLLSSVTAHSAFFHPSMWGFNVTDKDFPYDNRPVSPLRDMTFNEWWFHNHLDFPPHPEDKFLLPAGSAATAEIACTKSATSYHASSEGGDIRDPNDPNNPCPNSPSIAFHAHNEEDAMGCALAIAYKSDVNEVTPEDFTVFSVNHTCVWNRFTDFQVPKRMPPCPEGGCICAFFWVHSENGGGEENYMNGFRCDVTGAEANVNVKVAKSRVARRCGRDEKRGRFTNDLGNCTAGAKTPFYWVQAERNNMFEGPHSPPVYNDLYGFSNGAQDDIFEDSYITSPLPEPAPGAPVPVLRTVFDGPPPPVGPVIAVPADPSPSPSPSSSSSPVGPTSNPEPIFTPQKACRLRRPSAGSSLTKRHEDEIRLEDCNPIGLFGRRLYSYTKKHRRGVHPSEASKLWWGLW
ncbi:hypothetical protein CC1G_06169 [Coprinopsis cinerea okayama7|uniref:Uncharacterized protein n=1 Tax=Coprinopsis cinerea (strain Okayama-7 / 130 / ATCC MYA-4618 / FGSC 9003) TaxID=240176 RepID=A8NV23_COPC7|nr:hypothetical protein CC1G_06169 [Coprinopsis cinerea okayama7\|eukprot:XP_001836582.1 hypothetical protein CC1G_06169 [Coprinopsis cinerea okayama7\